MVTSIEGEVFPDLAIHPGELLGEELEEHGLSIEEFAQSINRPAAVVRDVVEGRTPMTADTAVAIERVLGIPARLWMNLQVRYELTIAYHAAEQPQRVAI